MSPKKKPQPDPEEEREPSRTGGVLVLTALGGGAVAAFYAVAPAAGPIVVWVVGMTAMWRVARSVPRAANPAPPPPPEGADDTKPQFTIVEDREGHCVVQWTRGATKP